MGTVGVVGPGVAVGGDAPIAASATVELHTTFVPDETGEIVMAGPQIFLGYWNRPEETADALRKGWIDRKSVV